MNIMIKCVNSLIASIITTAFILTISFMIMLFSNGEDGYRTYYFGSIFFNSTATSEETFDLQFGVSNGIPIVITIGILFLIYLLLFMLTKKKTISHEGHISS